MKKLILLTSVAVFSFGMLSESRADIIASGDDCAAKGSTCHWEIDSNGKLTITGSGAMKENFGNTERKDNPKVDSGVTTAASWGNYHSSITSIEIGEGITDTGARSFQGLANVTSVTIPTSLTTLGAFAFDRQPDLVNFNVPEGSKLTNFSGNGTFQLSSSLNAEYAQKILDTVGYNNKINGTTFEIPYNTFYKGGLTGKITIPEGVTSIGEGAFYNATGLTSITIPDSVTSIGSMAFMYAYGLTSITIPDSVIRIGIGAFWGADSLTSITIPDNIDTKNWYSGTFQNLPGSTKIVCQGDLNKCYEKLARYFKNSDCPQNLINAGISCNCSNYCIDSNRVIKATDPLQCSGNYGWSGAGCSRKNADGSVPCASGFVEWDKQCWSEYPFAKKRWTPAEANEWLHDGNDNFVVITFKK